MSSELNWLTRQARPVLSLLTANLVFMVLGSGLSLLDPLVVRWLIDVALPKRDLRLVLFGTLVFCAVYLASVIVSYLSSFISCVVTQKMVFRIRVSLLRRIQTLPARYHGNSRVGETLYRLEQDVDRVAELSGDILPLRYPDGDHGRDGPRDHGSPELALDPGDRSTAPGLLLYCNVDTRPD